MSVPVDAVLVDADGPDPVPDPVKREDLWGGLIVWSPENYQSKTIHRTPDCNQLCRARTIIMDRLDEWPPGMSLCRSQDCWPVEQIIDQQRSCPYCDEVVDKLHLHLPCDGVQR